jgi:chromate reductase
MISVISGTNRPGSVSLKFAMYYVQLLKDRGVETNLIDLNKLPETYIFSALYDHQGKNSEFNKIKELVLQSDKFVFIVPEYNGSFPGVLKAFIDGLDYPGSFKDKKGALIGISSGVMGGSLALSHLTDILNYLGLHVLALKPRITRIEKNFIDGEVLDTVAKELINQQVNALLTF